MKWFLGLIVALNLLVGAVLMLRQPEPVDIHSHEVAPEQLKVLPPGWQSDAVASVPLAASEPVSASAPLVLAQTTASPLGKVVSVPGAVADKPRKTVSVPVNRTDKAEALQCAQWGELNNALLARVNGGLNSVHLSSDQISRHSLEGKTVVQRYWVYIPVSAVTRSLSSELKGKGFDSYIVQNEGEYKGALSLGLFAKHDGAQALIERLKKAGFDKSTVLARGKALMTRLDFKRLTETQLRALVALQQRLTPGIMLKTTACAH